MADRGLNVIDRTVDETHRWLNEISEELGHPDKQMAYHALRGVLFTLRDRLVVEEAVNLASQLPTLIRGIYFEGYKPADKPLKIRDRDEFLQRISSELQAAGGANAEAAARAVFTVLGRNISEGQERQVREMLPKEIRTLWPEGVA